MSSHQTAQAQPADGSLRRREATFRALADLVDQQVWTATPDGQLDYVNERVLTYFREPAERVLGSGWLSVLHPDDVAATLEVWSRSLTTGEPYETEFRLRRADGTYRAHIARAGPRRDDEGRVVAWFGTNTDVADERELRRLAAIVELADDPIIGVDLDARVTSWNRGARALYGHRPDEMLGQPISRLHPDDLLEEGREMHERVRAGETVRLDTERVGRDGGRIPVALTVSPLRDEAGAVVGSVAVSRDISERRAAEERLAAYALRQQELARRDALTGLLNLRAFHEQLEDLLSRTPEEAAVVSVALFDVDSLKALNDDFGHATGDRALKQLASVLVECTPSAGFAARLGGDGFALVLPGRTSAEARAVARKVLGTVAEANTGVRASFGVAGAPEHGTRPGELLAAADLELYSARATPEGRERFALAAEVLADRSSAPAHTIPRPAGQLDPIARQIVERGLETARAELGMSTAFLGEFVDDREVFRVLSGDGGSFGVQEGDSIPYEASFCSRMVAGSLDNVVVDARAHAGVRDLELTREAGIGAYVGVPVKLASGRVYGALCCVSHERAPDLVKQDARVLQVVAALVADQLDRHQAESERHARHAEAVTAAALLAALDARDPRTGEHSATVVDLARTVAHELGLPAAQVKNVERVALLHDVGKIGIPDNLLHKRGPLDRTEWELMRTHPTVGARIVAGIDSVAHIAPMIEAAHERWDGGGYPHQLAGEAIPVEARIVFACDAYDAMTTERPYRKALPPHDARDELQRHAGEEFDPQVVQALERVLERHHLSGPAVSGAR